MRINRIRTLNYLLSIFFLGATCTHAQIITIGDSGDFPNLAAASASTDAGDTLELQSQIFSDGSQFLYDLKGTASAPIVIIAKEEHQAIFRGGTEAIHLVRCSHVEINGIIVEQQSGNGINIDDGGDYNTPAKYITVRNCIFRDMIATGNNDLLKISGVDNFLIEHCSFIDGGDGGSGIDFVGCHHGIVQDCYFDNAGTSGIQNKGGTQHIRIQRNIFKNMSQRALNLGGNTGLQFFRPPLPNPIVSAFEAADLEVFSNIFIGNRAPIAYVGAVRIKVHNNTFYKPENWVFRILQETTEPGFLPCGDNEFKNNIVYLESDLTEVNIGPNTDPESFSISNNLWYNESSNSWSPDLPVIEMNQIIANPIFENIDEENFRISEVSPAVGAGVIVNEVELDFDLVSYNIPPSIGAFEGGTTTSMVKGFEQVENIKIFPNPVDRNSQIQLNLENEDVLLMIYNMSGTIICNKKLSAKQIDLANYDLGTGQYIIKAITKQGITYVGKLFLF